MRKIVAVNGASYRRTADPLYLREIQQPDTSASSIGHLSILFGQRYTRANKLLIYCRNIGQSCPNGAIRLCRASFDPRKVMTVSVSFVWKAFALFVLCMVYLLFTVPAKHDMMN